jgi:TonB family protein
VLGTTPMTATEVAPSEDLSYDLTLPGYDAVRLDHLVVDGPVLHLSAELLSADRIAKPTEIKQAPHAYETPDPDITPDQRLRGAEVMISVVVLRNGTIRDVQVEKTTDRWIGERCKEAVEQWKFNPGIGFNGQPLNVRVHIPFTIGRRGGT